MDYDNTNTGALFVNDKQGNEQRPDSKGSINVDGVEYWISAWRKTSKDGSKKFLSLQVERKDAHHAPRTQQKQAPAPEIDDEEDSDLPF